MDENVGNAIADGLRRRGIDVTTTSEEDMISALDEVQLEFALSQGRVIFTQDDERHPKGVASLHSFSQMSNDNCSTGHDIIYYTEGTIFLSLPSLLDVT